ncbi:MAG: PTS sugar transporter subunit IIA [Planctomycetota bacterium]
MDFPNHLLPDSVLLAPTVSDKWKLLESMVQAVADSWNMSPEIAEACQKCVFAREESASTGMEAGIAVPHAAVDGLEHLVIGMAILPDGLAFASLDGKPAQVVVLILVPKKEKLIHLQTLTEVARRLANADFRAQLLDSGSPADVIQLWS